MKTATSKRSSTLTGIFVLCLATALLLVNTASSKGPGSLSADRIKAPVRMFDVGLGRHTFKAQMESHYLGGSPLQQALQTGQAQPRTMVGEDFNGDGMGDLIIGYANNGSGILSFRTGNVQAIAPTDKTVFEGIQQGRYPAPFLPEAQLYYLPEAPDFLQVGDFNADGYEDVLAAARGGAALYLLPGDGRGNLGAVQKFELPGSLTALQANDSRQAGVFTSLALGLRTDDGAKTLIYNQAGGGLAGAPQSYAMPGEVTAFAFGRLSEDVTTDLAAATTNQVIVIHGIDQTANASKNSATASAQRLPAIETESLPFVIRGLAIGDFVWDRNHEREIAALSDDGTVYISARGNPDTRPFTDAEKNTLRDLKRSYMRQNIDMETFRAESNRLTRPNLAAGWKVSQTISSGVTPTANGAQPLFQRLDATTLPTDDLMIGNGLNNKVQMVRNDHDAAKLNIQATTKSVDLEQLSADSAPIAAVPMRLNIDNRPGTVVLKQGQVEPEIIIITPDTTFVVNSTADLADDVPTAANGVCHTSAGTCTLRAAIMQSNHTGGSNAITVPDGTYTINLGAPDDEANTGGATEQSGDLDIFNWNPFTAEPAITNVSITGGTRDGCIIQGGTFGTTLNTNSPNNTERILEVNDGATIQSKINVTLTNLTMQNAVEPTGSGTFLDGGAIFYDGSDATANTNVGLLTLHNVKLSANTSAGAGGGVWAGFGSLKIESTSIVRANTSQHKVAGGVEYNGGNSVETQFLLIDGSTIGGALVADGNQATDVTFGAGGGLDTRGGGVGGTTNGIVIQNGTVIQNNLAQSVNGVNGGGGIQIGNGPVFAFSNSTISNNSAKNMAGGLLSNAIQLSGANAAIALTSMTITGNTADSENNGTGDGGGIYNFTGSMTITGTTHIDGNTAVNGGGVFSTWNGNSITPSASFSMTGGTIGQAGAGNGNNAKNNGGGFALNPGGASTFGTVTLVTVPITNNTSNSDNSAGGDGGGIFVGSGNLNPLNGDTIDTNLGNAGGGGGLGTGIFMSGGTITGSGTISLNGGNSLDINGGTFTSTPGTFNLTGNFTRASASTFTHNSGTFNFNGAGAQSINGTATTEAFNNFTVNSGNTLTVGGSTTSLSMAGAVLLTAGGFNSGTATQITESGGDWTNNGGTFTPNAGIVSFTNTAGAQNINGTATTQTFNSITVAKTAQTLAVGGSTTNLTLNGSMLLTSGTFNRGTAGGISVAGDWTNNGGTFTTGGGGTVSFNGGGAQNLNGSAATQTFNNFAVSKSGGTLTGGGSTATLTLTGNMSITGGTFAAGTITTINAPGDWANTATFTAGSSTVNLTGNNNTQTLSGSTTFNNLTCNHTGTGNATATGSTLAVTGLMRVQSGTFISSSTYNNVQIDSGTTFQSDGSTINVSGNWTNNGGTFTPSGDTVNFNGAGAQSIGGSAATQTFSGFTVNKSGGTLSVAASTTTLTLTGAVTLTAGTFAAGTATTINVAGNWTNNGGTFTPGAGTTNFNGGAGQIIGGTTATTFNALTNSDAGGLAMNNDNTANGVLALTSSDITVASGKTLTQPSTAGASTGTFDVVGAIRRTGANLPNSALTYGNPDNVITLAGSTLTSLTVNLTKAGPTPAITGIVNSGWPAAVLRTYLITELPAGNFTPAGTTVQLHYLTTELNGNSEATPGPPASLRLYRYVVANPGTGWQQQDVGGANTTLSANHFVKVVGIKGFSPWTIANSSPTAESASIGGTITDANGAPISGATINLSGTESRETITDAKGNYNFDSVGTNGFYTVTPARVNYTFSPANRSFSLVGVHTDASFTATGNGDHLNAIDTTEFFVRQQYLDFLGREPDPPGFAGWVSTINNCAAGGPSCDRVHVSEAFFKSEEFQQRGYFVYRFYSAAFGQKPDYAAFAPDLARVSGFLDATQLEAAKTQFASDFVNRPVFISQYGTLGNAQYVDALAQTAGVTLSNRQVLVDSLAAGTLTRAQALRQIVESGEVYAKHYNQAFVVMEYFGYLKRDPDNLYLNWISVLDANPADSRRMVDGFVNSAEYRNRFNQ